MANRRCWHCDTRSHMTRISDPTLTNDQAAVLATFRCDECGYPSVALGDASWVRTGQKSALEILDGNNTKGLVWLPHTKEADDFPDVPTHIANAATEATLCLSIGAYRAVGSLARAVIEATCKDKHAKGGNLQERIDALHAADHIRKHTKAQAHEVRHFGNNMAHGDFADDVDQAEGEEIIELMKEILDEVYQSPARLERRKNARLASKSDPDE